jgi:outer membrane protein OmpA-like peptidoglycan-associated protein/flagellar hook assembly protein FlgD
MAGGRGFCRFGGVAFLLVLLASCATYRGDLPVSTQARDRMYISPGVPDGIQDRLIVTASVAEAYPDMRVGGYRFTVTDSRGAAVRTVGEQVVPQERRSRIVARPPAGIRFPAAFIWEGRNDNGDLVPEGQYTYSVTAWDVYGNAGESAGSVVVVDNTPPSVILSAPYTTFSPNGDGSKDTLRIRQAESTTEDEWRGEIRNAQGQVVRRFAWAGRLEDLNWDGKDDAGLPAPDGTYGYFVAAADLAGNKATVSLTELHVDTRPGAATLFVSPSSFSPDGDGVVDQIVISPRAENPTEVDHWTVTVRDGTGAARRAFAGPGAPPARIVFDGRDGSGAVLTDGAHDAELDLWYRNGDSASAVSPSFLVDTKRPEASVSAATLLFSPDGDGNGDVIAVEQRSSEEALWEGLVRDGSGRTVLARYWQGIAESWEWDGRDASGKIVPDGTYTYALKSTDAAGNAGGAGLAGVVVDARPTPVSLSLDFFAFAPVAGSRRPILHVLPSVALQEGIDSWTVQIQNAAGAALKTFSGTGNVPSSLPYDGRDDAGKVLPDGSGYRGLLRVTYRKGDRAEALSPIFTIKTVPPVGRVSADALVFSPDGDGRNETLTFRQSGSAEDLWIGTVVNEAGLSVYSLSWRGRPAQWIWDGRDADGRVVPDGAYAYRLEATDAADNVSLVELGGIRVDTRGGTATLEASSAGLSPNGDGVADALTFRVSAQPTAGMKAWSLALLDGRREVAKLFSGSGARGLPAEVVWDGRTGSGRVVEGSYTAELVVEYERGTVARAALGSSVVVDVTGPRVEVTPRPLPFSPDGDGVDDAVTVTLSAQGRAPVTSWSLLVLDPEGNPFARFGGVGAPPATLSWNGLSPEGELVQSAADYKLVATATDNLGNTGRGTSGLPVDILVVRDGDKLRIVISSIYFQEYTADYRDVPAERARKNKDTLDRLAEKLGRYPQHRIGIEGHAVQVYWEDPVLRAREERETLLPLSLARANVVRQALVERGIAADRMTTVGFGGSQPVVPHSDAVNRWKNRRVEFVLVKQ